MTMTTNQPVDATLRVTKGQPSVTCPVCGMTMAAKKKDRIPSHTPTGGRPQARKGRPPCPGSSPYLPPPIKLRRADPSEEYANGGTLIDRLEILELFDIPNVGAARNRVKSWIRDHKFPEPVAERGTNAQLWNRAAVLTWAERWKRAGAWNLP